MQLVSVGRNDYPRLIQIWEASVRATHDFLSEADILALKPLILAQYFDAVSLTAARNDAGELLGFSGVAEGNLEMLFIAPEQRGQGVGAALCRHAIEQQAVTKVDVNEQNPQAIGFYLRMGFAQVGRSELDGQGNPFPLLHLALA